MIKSLRDSDDQYCTGLFLHYRDDFYSCGTAIFACYINIQQYYSVRQRWIDFDCEIEISRQSMMDLFNNTCNHQDYRNNCDNDVLILQYKNTHYCTGLHTIQYYHSLYQREISNPVHTHSQNICPVFQQTPERQLIHQYINNHAYTAVLKKFAAKKFLPMLC